MRRRTLLPLLAAVSAGIGLSACGIGSSGPRRDFFLLRDAGTGEAIPGPPIDKVLLVSAMALPGLYDGDRMIFSADGRSRSTFQFGYWSERPAQALQTLALARLGQAGRFREVASSTSGVRGELLLSLRLDELYLDTSHEPDRVSLAVTAELIEWRERRLLGRQAFRQSQAVQQDGAGGLADAASAAMGRLLGELVDWTVARSQAAAG